MINRLRGSGKKVALLITAVVLLLGLTVNSAFAYGFYPFNYFSNSGGAGFWGGMMGGGMMGGYGYGYGYGQTPLAEAIDMEKADEILDSYLTAIGDANLKLAEVMEFDNHYYAELQEKDTGKYALELILDKYTGALYPEMGPNMMWNEKYGHMGGMMGWGYGLSSTQQKITPEQAVSSAQKFLDRSLPGVTAFEPHEFYGYYTLHTKKDGEIIGMLSVNSSTGSVWYHTWHGRFLGMEEDEHQDGE